MRNRLISGKVPQTYMSQDFVSQSFLKEPERYISFFLVPLGVYLVVWSVVMLSVQKVLRTKDLLFDTVKVESKDVTKIVSRDSNSMSPVRFYYIIRGMTFTSHITLFLFPSLLLNLFTFRLLFSFLEGSTWVFHIILIYPPFSKLFRFDDMYMVNKTIKLFYLQIRYLQLFTTETKKWNIILEELSYKSCIIHVKLILFSGCVYCMFIVNHQSYCILDLGSSPQG